MSTAQVLMFDSRRLGTAVMRMRNHTSSVRGGVQPANEHSGGDSQGMQGLRQAKSASPSRVRRPLCHGSKLHLVQASAAVRREPAVRAADAPLAKTYSPELYRQHTEGVLRRYMKMSLEMGRTPSWLGRDLFRSGVVSHNSVYSFEDVVIFVCDVEKCVGLLDGRARKLLTRIGMQEYTYAEVAGQLETSERTVVRMYQQALDALTTLLIDRGIMKPFVL